MQARMPLKAAAPFVAGALLGRLAASVRPAGPVQAKDKPMATAELHSTVRPVLALANQYRRWEFDDLSRRLDNQSTAALPYKGLVPSPTSSALGLSPDGRQMLQAIDELPENEREIFDLGRIQGMMQAEAAQALGVWAVTVRRRLSRGLRPLTEQLADLRPGDKPPDSI
jgi:RNA polymerase sigma factor (sigma-70 family)